MLRTHVMIRNIGMKNIFSVPLLIDFCSCTPLIQSYHFLFLNLPLLPLLPPHPSSLPPSHPPSFSTSYPPSLSLTLPLSLSLTLSPSLLHSHPPSHPLTLPLTHSPSLCSEESGIGTEFVRYAFSRFQQPTHFFKMSIFSVFKKFKYRSFYRHNISSCNYLMLNFEKLMR